jgi:uncharacterized protein involved in exopolysaccharide biosynthesis
VARRRKAMLAIPVIAVTILSAVAATLLPRLYESSTRILVQRSEVTNPLASLANAVSQTSDDPLRSFDEIIYSQRTLQMLIDSLDLGESAKSEVEHRALMDRVKKNIQTKTQARESFSITYYDSDPARAQKGAALLASFFIQTRMGTLAEKNAQTVKFYQEKLDEFKGKMEVSQKDVVNTLRGRSQTAIAATTGAYMRIDQVEQQLRESERLTGVYEQTLALLSMFPGAMGTKDGMTSLYEVQRSGVPYTQDLSQLLREYDDVSQRFTPKHPEVKKIEQQMLAVLERMQVSLESELKKQKVQANELRKNKGAMMEELMSSAVVQQSDQDKESSYRLYQKLYDDMKVKLEEAQINQTLGRDAENQYIIIDQALLPLFPSKPSRVLIVAGGFAAGLLIGIFSVIIAELLDTTIRTPREIAVYQKPIIAFLLEGRKELP